MALLPGNHDVGDIPPDPETGQGVTTERRDRFRRIWGSDWWCEEAEGWLIVGLNSLLFGSDLPAEAEQWRWLSGLARDAGRRPIMLMLHKPLCLWGLDEPGVTQSTVTPEGRRRLAEALGGARIDLVASGHLHQFRALLLDRMTMVWAPSTAYLSRRHEPSRYGGVKVLGMVEYQFRGRSVTWSVIRLPALVDDDTDEHAALDMTTSCGLQPAGD